MKNASKQYFVLIYVEFKQSINESDAQLEFVMLSLLNFNPHSMHPLWLLIYDLYNMMV